MAFDYLLMTPRDMAKMVLLFLRNCVWDRAELIDAEYVNAATARQAPGRPPPEGVGYGFLWWVDDLACPPAYFAGGHGGQYIYVVPDLDLVVTTADAHAASRPFGRALRTVIESYVVRAVRRDHSRCGTQMARNHPWTSATMWTAPRLL